MADLGMVDFVIVTIYQEGNQDKAIGELSTEYALAVS